MNDPEKKVSYETLWVKSSVAAEFQRMCKTNSESQSDVLLSLMKSFEEREHYHKEVLEAHFKALEELFKKRISGVIAVIKIMEKNQVKPTLAILQTLFEEAEPKKHPLRIEKKAISGNIRKIQ